MSGAALTVHLRIDLTQDVVLSRTAASSGLHQTLDHIPGGVLLGVAAAAYQSIDRRDPALSWAVFHAGGVKFGSGLPLQNNEVFVPRPFDQRDHKQRDQGTYFAASGRSLTPAQRYRRRTAINPRTGRALETALFGHSSLVAGQSFASRLDIAPDCIAATEELLAALTAGPVWIGRSRGAEYGQVRITRLAGAPITPRHGPLTEDLLRFLMVSDCACPGRGLPDAAMLGLPAGWVARPEGGIQWRRYAPFNFHRRAFDPERVVLAQGSVLTFAGPPLDAQAQHHLLATLDAGIGLHISEGLGAVLVQFNQDAIDPPNARTRPTPAESEVVPPDGPLFQWLSQRHAASWLGALARIESRAYEQKFRQLYRELWREGRVAGRSPNDSAPSRAQWGRVREEGLRASSCDMLLRRLFDPAEGVCGAGTGSAPWRAEAPARRLSGEAASAADLLRHAIDPRRLEQILANEEQPATSVIELARLIVADLSTLVPRIMEDEQRGTA
jgi:CRISPR-associated protein Csx10